MTLNCSQTDRDERCCCVFSLTHTLSLPLTIFGVNFNFNFHSSKCLTYYVFAHVQHFVFCTRGKRKKHTRILLTVSFRAYCVNVLGVWWPMTVRATNQPFSYIFRWAAAHLKFIAIKQFTYLIIIITHWIHSSQTSINTKLPFLHT